ncbi:MAG: RidA family protein [Pseudomonadaceae bacterium]|nr:RidA family protein [Pseudomonadaceae bacterium]
MSIESIVPEGQEALYNQFHFAQAVRSGEFLFCSGQIGSDGSGGVPDAPLDEFRLAWKAVGTVLAAAGLDYKDIVELTTYHVGLNEHLASFIEAKDEVLSEPWPAWSAIGVSELAVPGARVEVRVIARSVNR